jgi:hypothetical protein
MALIAVVATLMLRDVPEFSALKLPPAGTNAQASVSAAYAMANAAESHAQLLSEWTVAKRVRRKPGRVAGAHASDPASEAVAVHSVAVAAWVS